MLDTYSEALSAHYAATWGLAAATETLKRGPMDQVAPNFCVLVFAPRSSWTLWTYATVGMSDAGNESPLELHLFSPVRSEMHVETLTAVAHFHRTRARLDLNHSVNLGRSWLDDSICDHALLSLPYLHGPTIEWCKQRGRLDIRCLWLLPISRSERDFKETYGVDALEARFDAPPLDYANPRRAPVV